MVGPYTILELGVSFDERKSYWLVYDESHYYEIILISFDISTEVSK